MQLKPVSIRNNQNLAKIKLTLYIDKSTFMVIGTNAIVNKMKDITIQVNNIELKQVVKCKYLGIILDNTLTL